MDGPIEEITIHNPKNKLLATAILITLLFIDGFGFDLVCVLMTSK